MRSFIIKPILGLKTNVAPNDSSLFKQVGDSTFETHCVDGRNVDYGRMRRSCAKSEGQTPWNAYIDLQGEYVETDVGADRLSVSTETATVTTIDNDETVSLYKKFGTAPFDANVEVNFKINISAMSNNQEIQIAGFSDNTALGAADNFISARFVGDGGTAFNPGVQFNHGSGRTAVEWTSAAAELSFSTDYYCTFRRDESATTYGTLYLTIYSDAARSTVVYQDEYDIQTQADDFDYFLPFANIDSGGGGDSCSFVLSEFEIITPEDFPALGIFELYDGSNRIVWTARNIGNEGHIFRYTGRRARRVSDQAAPAHTSATAFASGDTDLYSMIRYGDYFVFSDWGEHTPYASDHNDATLSKMVSSGTEYKGRYIESFQRRIVLANVTAGITSHGEISVIWTDANPVPTSSCTFGTGDPPSNHLYLPVDDEITGIRRMGRNACFVYSENSINRLDYFVDFDTPFGFTTMIENEGFTNHHSVVDAGGVHFGFNKNLGFCRYEGGRQIYPVSIEIEDWIASIRAGSYGHIVGVHIPFKYEIAWTVPLVDSVPNAILFYNYLEKKWRRKDVSARYLSTATITTNLTWTDLTNLGYNTWSDFGNMRWSDFINESPSVMLANTNFDLYYEATEADDGNDFDGYRVEPVLDFGVDNDLSLLLEIWFDIEANGSYNLYVYHRSGKTVAECTGSAWTVLDEVSCNDPATAITRLADVNRYHQIRWGTDARNEPFIVNSIEFKYVSQGRY